MTRENPVKLALATLLAVGSVGYMAVTIFDIDLGDSSNFSLSSLWDSVSSQGGEDLTHFATEIEAPRVEAPVLEMEPQEPEPALNLNTGGTLQELEDTLLEDRLWEESIARSREPGVRSGQQVLDALAEISSWSPIDEGYNQERLNLYLRNPKIWVRLSAFAFALKAGALSDKQIVTMTRLIDLKTHSNPSQVRRFLTRYQRSDPELYQDLMDRLILRRGALPDEPPPSQEEEYSQDAS